MNVEMVCRINRWISRQMPRPRRAEKSWGLRLACIRTWVLSSPAAPCRPPKCGRKLNGVVSGPAATILVVDDHEVVRSGLVAEIDREEGFSVAGVAGNGADAFEWAVKHRPDLVLMDWRLPDKTGVDVCRELREAAPDVRVVILTTYINEETVRQALAAGARGYVTKSAGLDALFDAMRDALNDSSELGTASQVVEHLHEMLDDRMQPVALTPQQQNVLDLAAEGLTNQEIADRLFLSESTVRFHLKALRGKLEASSKAGLIAKAVRLGLLPPADEASNPKEN